LVPDVSPAMQNQRQVISSSSGVVALEGEFGGGVGCSWAGLSPPPLVSLVEFPELEVKRSRKKRRKERKHKSSSSAAAAARDGAVSRSAAGVCGDDSGPESEYSLENGLNWNDVEVWKQESQDEVWRERPQQMFLDHENDVEVWKKPQQQQQVRREEQNYLVHGSGGGGNSSKRSNKKERRKEGKKEERREISSGTETNTGRKLKRRKEMETAVPWTEEMVQYLFETYDDVHRRLWIESRGKVKNQKKWDPIIKTMQERFRREFTKNQCESKYWKVRRECTKYKAKLEKKRGADITADHYPGNNNGGGAVRELLKPKFFDVWFEAAGKSTAPMPEIEISSGSVEVMMRGKVSHEEQHIGSEKEEEEDGEEEDADRRRHQRHKHTRSGCEIVQEMQQAISMQLEASEKREEALNIRAELTMELLRQHMERMERTGMTVEEARRRQLHMIEGVDSKLDRLVQGLNELNGNIGALVGRLQAFNQR
jgi:hypothetical protein